MQKPQQIMILERERGGDNHILINEETHPSKHVVVRIMCTNDRGDRIIPNPSS
jgi:hypothetical protein